MATYYVRKNGNDNSGDGSTGSPWQTIQHADGDNRVSGGDTVKIGPGVYREKVVFRKADVTWEAENPNDRPIIDGNYGPSEVANDHSAKSSYIPGSMYESIVQVRANDVVLDGIVIRNVAGEGLNILNAKRVTVRNCLLYHIYNQGCVIEDGSDDFTFEDSEIYVTSLKTKVPVSKQSITTPGDADPYKGGGQILSKRNSGALIQRNAFAYAYGETCDFGKGTTDAIIQDNVAHDSNHILYYNISSKRVTWRRNVGYISPDPPHLANDGDVPGGMVYGDEAKTAAKEGKSWGMRCYNNLIVNSSALLQSRWNKKNPDKPEKGYWNTHLDRCAIEYNTFVAGPKTLKGVFIQGDPNVGTWHEDTIIANNVFDFTNAPSNCIKWKWSGARGGVYFRNNSWTSQPSSEFRGPGDQYGNVNLANPGRPISVGGDYDYETTNFNVNNYKLTSSSTKAIGKASDASRVNGYNVDPIFYNTTTEPRTDYFGATRGTPACIGFHEFDGVIVDPPEDEPTVNASFTIDDNDGFAPHTITVTDTTTVENDTIASRSWDWGDGSPPSTASGPSHTYPDTGIYVVRLTVTTTSGLQDSATGSVTVRASDDGGGDESDAITDATDRAVPTTANTEFDVTLSLDGMVPKWAIILLTKATALDTTVDDAVLSIGLWGSTPGPVAGPRDVAIYISSEDGESAASQMRLMAPGYAGFYRDFDTLATYNFSVISASANTLTLKTGSAAWPAGYKIVAFAGSGSDTKGQIVYWNPLGVQDQTIRPTHTVNASFLLSASSFANSGSVSAGSELSIGLAVSPDNQCNVYWGQPEGASPSFNKTRFSNDRFGFARYHTNGIENVAARINLDALTATGAEITVRQNGINRPFAYLAVETDAPVDLRTYSVPLSDAAPKTFPLDFDPAAWIALPMSVSATGNAEDAAGGIGIYVGDGTDEYTALFTNVSGESTHDTKSEIASGLTARKADGTSAFSGSIQPLTKGVEVSVTDVSVSEAYLFHLLTIGGTAGGGTTPPTTLPNADFTYSPASPFVGDTVQFQDLSNGNGETITLWEWNINNGEYTESSASDGDIEYIFRLPGSYTVSLTVTTVAGSSTRTKTVNVLEASGEEPSPVQVYGPPFPQPITENTKSIFIGDPFHPLAGYLYLGLQLGYLPIAYNIEELPIREDEVSVAIIDDDLVLRRPDGAVGTFDVTWTPVTPPVANFTANQTTIADGGSVVFNNTSTNYSRVLWDFGDGSPPSEVDEPTHQYDDIGTYTVTLTVFNSYGDSKQIIKTGFVTVVDELPSQTITVQISASTDDGRERSGPLMDTDDLAIILSGADMWAMLRFDISEVSSGDTIESAYLDIYAHDATDLVASDDLYIEDVDSPATGDASDNDNITSRTLSTEKVTWSETLSETGWHRSPDIGAVIQEAVARPGFSGIVNVIMDHLTGDDLSFRSWDYSDGSFAAKLEVTFSSGA